jgi:hypothetical protein
MERFAVLDEGREPERGQARIELRVRVPLEKVSG